jgi:predicted RNase H-like nuclease (RuvC/YqgF family)
VSQLKPSFIAEIKAALEAARFTSDDFKLEFPKSGRTLVKITFAYKPEYFFALFEDTKREEIKVEQRYAMTSRSQTIEETIFSVKAAPGKYKTEDDLELGDIGKLIEQIPKWCDNIRADLYATGPKHDPLAALREQLQRNLYALVDKPDEFFDADELAIIDTRFDELFAEISKLREQYSLTKQQLDTLQKELAEFKKSARAYPKGLWAKITGNSLVKATGQMINSPEGRTFIIQEIRRALGLSSDT